MAMHQEDKNLYVLIASLGVTEVLQGYIEDRPLLKQTEPSIVDFYYINLHFCSLSF